MIASLFNPETGDGAGSRQERLSLTWRRPDPRFGYYEILSRLPVASGRYELRAGVKTGDGRTASLYTSVQVPNFDDDLALSGLVLNATPSPTVASADAVSDLLPLLPTSRRLFRSSDEAVAFLRIYQRTASFSAATVTTRLTSANDNVLANDTQRLEGETVGLRSSADYEVALPLKSLAAGEYLLTIVVTVGNEHPQRQLRFRVE
jgi:hypothetical protein